MTIVVGLPACVRSVDGYLRHDTPARYAAAVHEAAGALPVMIPPLGEAQTAILDRLDGLLLPGSPSNVHPKYYGGGESLTPDHHDLDRDSTSLPMIRAAIARGLPVLAICRGIQELNVALGGTLHQKVHELPGRMDHRGGPGDMAQRYRPKHAVALQGKLAEIIGAREAMVNSVHGQAIDRVADGLGVAATAPDGIVEAVWMPNAPGFVLGIQWHPEWRWQDDPVSMAIFRAFGDACRAWRAQHGFGQGQRSAA
jgi:putative glutamine amidotransferase